ncbi:hypothetical protein [Micromonospora musae]
MNEPPPTALTGRARRAPDEPDDSRHDAARLVTTASPQRVREHPRLVTLR